MKMHPGFEPPFLIFPLPGGGFRLYAGHESLFPGESLDQAEARARILGAHVAGGLRYGRAERKASGFWGVYPDVRELGSEELSRVASPSPVFLGSLSASMDSRAYVAAFALIKEALERGECYQANLCFSLRGKAVSVPPWSWRSALRLWLDLVEPKGDRSLGQGAHACFAACPSGEIVASLSPELFFSIDDDLVEARPMKGTAPRDPDPSRDAALREGLCASPKDRAENLMILDMVRNDLGRVALPGCVEVPEAFVIEAYPSLYQMTSAVRARRPEGASLSSLMEALFPCASITGAPKLASQDLLSSAEEGERGWYTGTLGWYAPRDARSGTQEGSFTVLIRSLCFPEAGDPSFSLGIGGGVVWDSEPESEYREALLKSRFLDPAARGFDLLEALLWEEGGGFFLLNFHADRLEAACRAFGGGLDRAEFLERAEGAVLEARRRGIAGSLKVRVLVDPGFRLRAEAEALSPTPSVLRCAISERRLGPESEIFRLYKTSERGLYSGADRAGVDQLLFLNQRGELTESTSMNIVLEKDGNFLTPASSSILLDGCYRRHLLERGEIREAILTREDLEDADGLWLVNSVRRRVRARLAEG